MTTYQFSTELTHSGDLPVPTRYLDSIPSGSKVKVILIVEPSALPSNTSSEPEEESQRSSLEEYVAYLKSRPLPESLITPPTASFREYLAESEEAADGDFDVEEWNQQWDQIEAEMNAIEQLDAEQTLNQMRQDLKA